MKKILIAVAACLMFVVSSAQSGWVPYASKNKHIGLMADSLMYMPVKDTNYTPQRLGAYTMRPQDSCVYVGISMTAGTKRWARLAKYSEISGSLFRFGVSGEDNVAGQDRRFSGLGLYALEVDSMEYVYLNARTGMAGASPSYYLDSTGNYFNANVFMSSNPVIVFDTTSYKIVTRRSSDGLLYATSSWGSIIAPIARAAISLTTTGTSGAATYSGSTGVLNIPQYGAASGNGNYIQNQFASAQSADFWVQGRSKRDIGSGILVETMDSGDPDLPWKIEHGESVLEDFKQRIMMVRTATFDYPTGPAIYMESAAANASAYVHRVGVTKGGIELQTNNVGAGTMFYAENSGGKLTRRTASEFRGDIGAGTGSGTVTSFTFTDGNGFDGTVTNATTTPTLSLTTTAANKAFMYSNSGAIAGSAMMSQETDQILVTGNSAASTTPFVVTGHEDLTGNIMELKQSATAVFQFHESGYINIPEMSAPSTPASGYGSIYGKTDGKLYYKGDAGVEYDLTGGGGGVTATGTPVDNQIAVWTGAAAIEGTSNFTFDGNDLIVQTYNAANAYNGLTLNNTYGSGVVAQIFKMSSTTYGSFFASSLTSDAYGIIPGMNFRNDNGQDIGFATGSLGSMDGADLLIKASGDVIVQNNNLAIKTTSFGTSSVGVLAIGNGTPPGSSPANSIQLYAEDVAASSELKVRDEAGNVTTLSPHNFTGIPEGPSEKHAWTYHSERGGEYITVDMAKAIRTIEELTARVAALEGKKGKKKRPVKLIHTGKVKQE